MPAYILGIRQALESEDEAFYLRQAQWHLHYRPYKNSGPVKTCPAVCLQTAAQGRDVLFVGTKKQAQEAVKEAATRCGQHYVNNRWLGGTLTNNRHIRVSIKRMQEIEEMEEKARWKTCL